MLRVSGSRQDDFESANNTRQKDDEGHDSDTHKEDKKESIERAKVALAMRAIEMVGGTMLALGVGVAAATTLQQVDQAHKCGRALTARELTSTVAHTVASAMAGLITGAVLGPLRATSTMASLLARPVLGAVLIHRGALWAQRRITGAAKLLHQLHSGILELQLKALAGILSRALSSDRFRREFCRISGVDMLIQLLAEILALEAGPAALPGILPAGSGIVLSSSMPSTSLMEPLAEALEALLRCQEGKDRCLKAGGIPVILKMLNPSTASSATTEEPPKDVKPAAQTTSPDRHSIGSYLSASPRSSIGGSSLSETGIRSRHLSHLALTCLSHLSVSAQARDTIRVSGGLPLLVEMMPGESPLVAVKLLQVMASDPTTREAVGMAGATSALLDIVRTASPKSQLQSDAITALHALMRGSFENQLSLAQTPDAFMHLRSSLSGLGATWHPAKPDLNALLNILSRFSPDMPCHGAVLYCHPRPEAVPAAGRCDSATNNTDQAINEVGYQGVDEPFIVENDAEVDFEMVDS